MKDHPHRRALLGFSLALGLHSAAGAEGLQGDPTGALTLAQTLALAEERNPALHAARLEDRAADGRVIQAAAWQNPSLAVEAENFGGQDEPARFDAAEYTVQLEQVLEWGGQRGKRIRVAWCERQLTGMDLEAGRLDVRAETRRRFIGVLGAQARVGLARETVALAEDVVKAVGARVEAGKVSPLELEKARVLLAQERISLDLKLGELGTARTRLAAQWGDDRPVFDHVAGDLLAVPAVPALSNLTLRCSVNPDVARWAIESERAKAVVAREKAIRVPALTVAAGIRRASGTDGDTWVAGVSVPLPIFDRNRGGVREAQSLLDKAERQRQGAAVVTATELLTAHQALTAAVNKASALEKEVLSRIQTVFEAFQSGYTQGKYTYLEVLDAQRTLAEARADHLEALISAHTVLADLERIAGGPLPTAKQD